MLTCPGFRDDAPLAHAPRQQPLPQGVIDLVRARVQQVLALEVNTRAAQILREPPRMIKRRGAPGIVA
jgi:hypothetical protein